jgi:hypothetical protein
MEEIMFLKILNHGLLNRHFLELIGFGTKRNLPDDGRTIGEFGSGTKVAAVAALRLGLDLTICSADQLGRYRLSFVWQEVDLGGGTKTRQIFLVYTQPSEGGEDTVERKTWQVTLDAFKDWDQPIGRDDAPAYKVLREFICNAFDADPAFEIGWVEDDGLDYAPIDATVVYIRKNPNIQHVFDHIDRYIKFLANELKPIASVPGLGHVYQRSDPERTRLFVRGVLVNCSEDHWNSGLYDYDLLDKGLVSEDRTIKSAYAFQQKLGQLLVRVDDRSFLKTILQQSLNGRCPLETAALGYVYSLTDELRIIWRRFLVEIFGTDLLCLASGNRVIDQDAQQLMGYTVVGGTFSLQSFLREAVGLPTADKIISQDIKYSLLRFEDLDKTSRYNFEIAFQVFASFFPERAGLPIIFFLPENEAIRAKISGVAGLGESNFKEIWISALSATTLRSAMDLLRCLIHESRHIVTGAYDYDRNFVAMAENEILYLSMLVLNRRTDLDGRTLPKLRKPKGKSTVRPNIVAPRSIADAGSRKLSLSTIRKGAADSD